MILKGNVDRSRTLYNRFLRNSKRMRQRTVVMTQQRWPQTKIQKRITLPYKEGRWRAEFHFLKLDCWGDARGRLTETEGTKTKVENEIEGSYPVILRWKARVKISCIRRKLNTGGWRIRESRSARNKTIMIMILYKLWNVLWNRLLRRI